MPVDARRARRLLNLSLFWFWVTLVIACFFSDDVCEYANAMQQAGHHRF
jgi:hypothetical protein